MAIQAANARIRELAAESPELDGMGTTVVVASCADRCLFVANVGDSRLYVVNRSGIRQITRDHSWVEEMVRRGGIGREEARNHPDKNIITRAVGAEDTIKADFFMVRLEQNDRILMCTDGPICWRTRRSEWYWTEPGILWRRQRRLSRLPMRMAERTISV